MLKLVLQRPSAGKSLIIETYKASATTGKAIIIVTDFQAKDKLSELKDHRTNLFNLVIPKIDRHGAA